MAWPEIEAFYNIRKYTAAHPEILNGNSTVLYKAKVKLHGTNAAVQVGNNGVVECQSRTGIITPDNDNAGFARWVLATCMAPHQNTWDKAKGHIIFGEWCGPGIQKSVAISEIPKKILAIFAARPLDGSDRLIVEPKDLASLIVGIPDTYVLPWFDPAAGRIVSGSQDPIQIDWSRSSDDLQSTTNTINNWVAGVEAEDPWVKATFDVKGTGEGLVFYPVSQEHLGFANFSNLVFKAKGEKHKNIKTAAPAQVNPEMAASVEAFVELVLTPARLEQGATAVGGYDMKQTGKFVAWCLADVQKETTDELEASQLDWKQVQKPLGDKARIWYLEQSKK
jgi:hypothetical protein